MKSFLSFLLNKMLPWWVILFPLYTTGTGLETEASPEYAKSAIFQASVRGVHPSPSGSLDLEKQPLPVKLEQLVDGLKEEEKLRVLRWVFNATPRGSGRGGKCECGCQAVTPIEVNWLRVEALEIAMDMETQEAHIFALGVLSMYLLEGSRSQREQYPFNDIEYHRIVQNMKKLSERPALANKAWFREVAISPSIEYTLRASAFAGFLHYEFIRLNLVEPIDKARWLLPQIKVTGMEWDDWHHYAKKGDRFGKKQFALESGAKAGALVRLGLPVLPMVLIEWKKLDSKQKEKGLTREEKRRKYALSMVVNGIRHGNPVTRESMEWLPVQPENWKEVWIEKLQKFSEKNKLKTNDKKAIHNH